MRNEIEDPVRENRNADDQRRRLTVVAAMSAADSLINQRSNDTPKDRRDQTVRIRMEIRIEHAACRETFDDAQLLNPDQNQGRPDVVEKLNGDEQNPKRNLISIRPSSKSNAVMSNKHLPANCRAIVSNANVRRFTERSRREANDIDGKPGRVRERERANQIPSETICCCRSRFSRSPFSL